MGARRHTISEISDLVQGWRTGHAHSDAFVDDRHVWPLGHGAVAEHKKPGFVSVRQCLAAGQQNSVALHAAGGVHAAPGVTQSLVRGQQTSPVGHVEPALAQGILLAVRQCLASGQQGQRFLI
jgi:hypothetical protein